MAFDFYKSVPRDLEANLRYRVELRQRAATDIPFRRAMWTACKHDILFWFNAWCFLYEPRPRFNAEGRLLPKMIPFIVWDHQIPAIKAIKENLGTKDIGVEKSRGEGASWMAVLLALHDWLFDDMAKVGLVSKKEKDADDPGNMDSLFAKIDWELTKLPKWMAGVEKVDWTRNLAEHSLVNKRNGSQINAFAAVSDAGRSGRYKWFLCDELAFWDAGDDRRFLESVRSSTDSRLIISTPNGSDGAYYDFMHTPSSRTVKVILDWKDNPSRNRGLYQFENGKPAAVNPKNPLPPEYDPPNAATLDLFSSLRRKGFKLEGRLRSPWYDRECDKADATPSSIAQELDRDYGGSLHRIFLHDFNKSVEATVKKPLIRGVMRYHPETLAPEFEPDENGPVKLWMPLDHARNPPASVYVVGADISSGLAGSFTSNSVVQAIDWVRKEQVLEFATNTEQPADFAETCLAIVQWLYDAFFAWEINYGGGFTKRVKDFGYGNVYYRQVLGKKGRKTTTELGWHTNDTSKQTLLDSLRREATNGGVIIRSEDLLKECGHYVMKNGKIVCILAERTEDDSSKGVAHGDRVMAFGVALMAALSRPFTREREADTLSGLIRPGTMAWRQREWEESQRDKSGGWDERTNWDLAHRGLGGSFLGGQ